MFTSQDTNDTITFDDDLPFPMSYVSYDMNDELFERIIALERRVKELEERNLPELPF